MAKKIRQAQVQNLVEDLGGLNNKQVKSVVFSGTTTKTLTVTFEDDTTITGTFSDLNTTYPALTEAQLNTGTATTQSTVTAKVLADYVNAKLTTIMRYKGSVATFAQLPSSDMVVGDMWNVAAAFTHEDKSYPAGSNVAWNGTDWDVLHGYIDTSVFLTAEADPKGVSAVSVSGTTTKTITITLNDSTTVTGNFSDLNTTYTAGDGLTLTGSTFSLPVTTSGTGTFVQSITQNANGITATLGTPPNTTYTTGTQGDLETGSNSTGMLWSAATLTGFLNALSVTVTHATTTITSGMISGGNVTIPLTPVPTNKSRILVFLNGIKQPEAAYSISSTNLVIVQASLPTPILADDEIELYYV